MTSKLNNFKRIMLVAATSSVIGVQVGQTVHNVAADDTQLTIQVNCDDNQQKIITSTGYGDLVFLNYLGLSAQKLANNNDIYASVMLAQALLESGWGTSALAQAPNYNLFGVKGKYQGEGVSFATQEDDGNGNLYGIQSSFRKYPSYKESLEDYVRVLRDNGIYKRTWKSNTDSYKDATRCLTGSYATDTSYYKKLDAIIEKYDLTRFDQPLDWQQTTSGNDIIVSHLGWAANADNNDRETTGVGTYDVQQAPVIVPDKFLKDDYVETSGKVFVAPEVTVNNSITDLINYNKEIAQQPVTIEKPVDEKVPSTPKDGDKDNQVQVDSTNSKKEPKPADKIKESPSIQVKKGN